MALTILPYNDRSPVKSKQKAEAFSKAVQGGAEAWGKYEEDKALKEKYGIDLAGIRDPETRSQIIAQELASGKKRIQAKQGLETNYFPGNEESPIPDVKTTKQPLPEFGEVEGKKTSKAPQQISKQYEDMGSMPQPETQGIKRPLLSPDQIMNQAKQVAQMSMGTSNPVTPEQVYSSLNEKNEDNRRYNASVDLDIAKRVESQDRYGNIAVDSLRKVMEFPTEEQESILRKYGEEAALEGKSEADIRRSIAEKATNFSKMISNVENSIPRKGLGETVKRGALGTNRSEEKIQTGIKIKLKPLLDMGLYDTARNLLSKLDYQPEEREALITELPEGTNKILASFPKIDLPKVEKGGVKSIFPTTAASSAKKDVMRPISEPQDTYTPQQIEQINSTVSNVFKTDPSTNIILLRKAMEDKNVDWIAFKDALDKGILDGTIKLSDDQFYSQLPIMDQGPLDNLDKMAYKFNMIGR